ncbi:GreA/GreB family elongation factor [Rubripirellula obstinata]|nr:GreA/GreB family elongation factor [Rubripirellula obstinata]
MNSTIELIDLDRDESETLTLVYPDEASSAEGKLSILSPLGSELLGRRVGESVTLHLLQRETRKRVQKVAFQPERVGAFNL